MWEDEEKHLGVLEPKTKLKFSYKYLGDKKIIMVKALCQKCTEVRLKNNEILTIFKVENKPEHLKHVPVFVSKEIEVTFVDGTKDTLKFKGVMR